MAKKEITEKEIEEHIKVCQRFSDHQKSLKCERFMLNPDKEVVKRLIKGELVNEKNHKLKYCPCRLTTGDWEADLKLVCPCNFQIQKTWKEKGQCWCSLYVKSA